MFASSKLRRQMSVLAVAAVAAVFLCSGLAGAASASSHYRAEVTVVNHTGRALAFNQADSWLYAPSKILGLNTAHFRGDAKPGPLMNGERQVIVGHGSWRARYLNVGLTFSDPHATTNYAEIHARVSIPGYPTEAFTHSYGDIVADTTMNLRRVGKIYRLYATVHLKPRPMLHCGLKPPRAESQAETNLPEPIVCIFPSDPDQATPAETAAAPAGEQPAATTEQSAPPAPPAS